ncbi:MAG: ribonuclease PH [bacterium]
MRKDGRKENQMRSVTITSNYLIHLRSSVLIEVGNTKVICAATIEDKVPFFLKGTNQGWIKAEYAMLPSSTPQRTERESSRGKIGGRTHEIQRLIGRSLRAVVDLNSIGEKTIRIDCDVIQADGGTRAASITGAFVAMAELFKELQNANKIKSFPLTDFVAATSAGIVQGVPLLDLNYEEDSTAQVDINLVMTGRGKIVEIQGTAEGNPFSFEDLNNLTNLAKKGIEELICVQKQIIEMDV